VAAVPCEEVLKLGPEPFLARYAPPYERRIDRLRIHDVLAERYQKCRTDTYREQFGKLSREERLWVDSLRNEVKEYIGSLNLLRALCTPREGWPYDRRDVLARMELEDVLADTMPLLISPEAQQAPRCGEQDFSPFRQKAAALLARPCPPPKHADEELRLLHQRDLNTYGGGFSNSVDDLKSYCEHFPRPGMQKIFAFTHELIDEK
jgi:hypothetical protein